MQRLEAGLGSGIETPPSRSSRGLRRYYVAYGCYLVTGLSALSLMSFNFASQPTYTMLVMLSVFWLPLSFIALLVALGLSIVIRDDWRLTLLAGALLLVIADALIDVASEKVEFMLAAVVGWGYGAVATVVPLWWFAVGRGKRNVAMVLDGRRGS